MVEHTKQSGNERRISIRCNCGKMLAALPKHSGKRLKCPACNQFVAVPAKASQPPPPLPNTENDLPQGLNKTTLIALWSLVGLFVFGSILFLLWYTNSSRQAGIAAADDRISSAVASAKQWLDGDTLRDGKVVEQELADALENEEATNKAAGYDMLRKVQRRLEQLADEARIDRAKRKEASVIRSAHRRIEDGKIPEAIVLLREYVADPQAAEQGNAQRLLAQAEEAISNELNLDMLTRMSDEEFDQVKAAGTIDTGESTHPKLASARRETVRRNIEAAERRRNDIKRAQEEAKAEEQRRKIAEARRRANERLSLHFLYLPISTDKENIIYVSKTYGMSDRRADTGDLFGNSLFVMYDGKGPEGGEFYNIDGKPSKATVVVDNSDVVSVDGNKLTFKNPGKAVVTVKLGAYTTSAAFNVIELPIPAIAKRDDVIEVLGFPDQKSKGSVGWPETETVDGVYYSPKVTRFGVGSIFYEHWRYRKFPGLVLAWGDGFKVLTRKPE